MITVKKADVLTGKTGNGENYRILRTPAIFGKDTFHSDMKAGASFFKECENVLLKKLERCVVIEANNEEEGLVAITYMNAMANEDYRMSLVDEDGSIDETEYDEWDDGWDMDDDEDILDYLGGGTMIPIVPFSEANSQINKDSMLPFSMGDQRFLAPVNKDGLIPYWMDISSIPIIIVKDETVGYGSRFNDFDDRIINYFGPNRRVFYLVIREDESERQSKEIFFDPEELGNEGVSFARFLMNHTADRINVTASDADIEKYDVELFKSWLDQYGMRVDKAEDIEEIVKNIVSFDPVYPMTSMEKTLKYIRHLEPETTEISLDTLRRFGLISPAKTEQASGTSLDKLIGLDRVKSEVRGIVQYTRFYKDMLKKGVIKGELHNVYMFVGAPGTAKTTVAKELGRMMKNAGILRRDRFISVTGAELKGQFVGWTAPKVAELFDKNDIILIDEAYSLTSSTNGEMDTYAQEALAQLAIELEEHSADKVVIFAGYGGNVSDRDNKMEEFLRANPGIKSRISAYVVFDSYSGEEMLSIIHGIAHEKGLSMVHTADREIVSYFNERSKSDTFGNGREARNFVDSALKKVANRYDPTKPVTKSAYTITKKDIQETIESLRKEPGRLSRTFHFGF
ncbi:AAA+-type ATPase, SpoVK/Ycf46/Vps4 family [Lachnospiraceae bacterium NE2001]|nr:AAA+-type ATPase, SpoVK/Ycf46/Vps4 family [Lachnospiraceae bacterium NE2001]